MIWKKLDKLIVEFCSWADENLVSIDKPVEKMEKFISYSQEVSSLFSKLVSFASLTTAVEATNETALKYFDKLVVKSPDLTKPNVQFQSFIKGLENLDDLISSSELLTEHEFYLSEIKRRSKYMLSEKKKSLFQN